MSLWRRGAGVLLSLSSVAAVVSLSGCGGSDMQIGVAKADAPVGPVADEWPPLALAPADAVSVQTCLSSADGAKVVVRAYLASVTTPCPTCNIGTRQVLREDAIGRTGRPEGPMAPGCAPCPDPAATISDDMPKASRTPSATLRAVAAAGGLQPRHVGHLFLLTGTFHARGASGPELEVTDVRALAAR